MFRDLIGNAWRGRAIGFGETNVGDDHAFWPGEATALTRATPARQAEFAAGRAAAREALRAVGLVPFAIPMGADRAPVWPVGVVGSITHHEGRCLAVAARRGALAGLGIDLEPLDPLPADLLPEITTGAERAWLSTQPEDLRGVLARVIFSAKEASYKALYPQLRAVVGFDAMDIRPDLPAGRFTATLNRRFGDYSVGLRLGGRSQVHDGVICTLMVLAAPASHAQRTVPGAGHDELEMQCFHASVG